MITDLKKLVLKINSNWNTAKIDGVYYKNLTTHTDTRGDLTELWSEPWHRKEKVASKIKHVYFNTTHQGVVKAWHAHVKTTSQYTCVYGKMQVVLVDARPKSPTFGQVDKYLIGTHNPSFIKIPPGVLKGWKSISGDSIIVNLLTTADSKDNIKFAWDSTLKNIWEPKNG